MDLGWHGSALGHLRLFAASQNKAMEVHGALMAGTRTWQSGIWQETGILHTWLFGDDKERTDRECGLPLDRRQVFCLEKLFSSPRPTLLRYSSRENGKTIFLLRSSAPYGRSSLEVREGILAFAGDIGCSGGPTLVGQIAGSFSDNLKTGLLAAVVFPLILILCSILLRRKKNPAATVGGGSDEQ